MSGLTEAEAALLMSADAVFSLGCQFASLVIDNFLAGILTMQIYKYFRYQSQDRLITRGVVAWTGLMNIVVTVYYWVYIQYLLVQNFGEWLPWLETRWLANMPLFDVLTVSVVQCFFAHRAFLLNKRNWYLFISILVLIGLAAGGGIAVMVIFGGLDSLLQAEQCAKAIYIWLSATTAADVLITVSIMYGLIKSKSGWEHTDRTIMRLVRLTFESQLLPTFLAVAYIVEYIEKPYSLLGAVFQSIQSKAYAVGLLFSLNARISFTHSVSQAYTTNTRPHVFGMTSSRRNPTEIQVDISTETYIHNEEDRKVDKADSVSDLEGFSSQARLAYPGARQ